MNNNGAQPPKISQDPSELALAVRYAPRILFDRNEPFLPLCVGYTIFRADGYSHSFPRCIGFTPVGRLPAVMAIEYAIWWDWDIQHLYELEHIWTYINTSGDVVHAEGSWHGNFGSLGNSDTGRPPLHDDTHPIALSQPGKHAFAAKQDVFFIMEDHIRSQCRAGVDSDGLLVTPLFQEAISSFKTAETDRLANAFLESQSFEPAFLWDRVFDITPDILIPWPALASWIPDRISWLVTWLQSELRGG